MKIAVIDDYQDAFRKTKAFPKLSGHEVIVYNDSEKDPEKLAARLKDAEAVVLTQQRSPFPRRGDRPSAEVEDDQPDRPQPRPR